MAGMTTEQALEISDARKKIIEAFRDMLTVKVTIPLGDPKLKEVHTNSFIWLPLLDYMDLANYEDIMRYVMPYLGESSRENMNYIRDRWYVEAINTTNDSSGKFQMELTLNPIASSNDTYRKNRTDWQKAFSDNFIVDDKHKVDIVGVTGTTSTTTTTVKSTGTNPTLKGGEGTFIDNLVKEIVGMETDQLKKAKLIHEHIRSKQHYSSYSCSKYTTAEACYKNITHLNCADMSRLTRAMMASAGLTCYVVHNNSGVGHFWVVIEIGGKKYASDNASSSSSGRAFDYFWNPSTQVTEKAVNGGKYYYNRGKNPSC